MIRVSIAALALAVALAACGGGGGGNASPAVAATATSSTDSTSAISGPVPSGAPQAAAAGSSAPTPTAGASAAQASPDTTTTVAAPQSASGLLASPADVANTTLAGAQSVRAVGALADGAYAVAWLSQDASGAASLFVQRYDTQGAKSGAETRVAYGVAAQESPAIAVLRDGSIIVASVASTSDASTVNWRVFVRRFDASGAASGAELTVATLAEAPAAARVRRYLAQPVLLALADGGAAVGWASVDEDYVGKINAQHVQRFDAQMNPIGNATDFPANGIDRNLSLKLVALPDGGFVAGTTHRFQGIPYVQFRIAGADVGALFDAQAGMPEFNTTLAPLADGRFALWSTGSTGGYMQLLDAAGHATSTTSVAVVPETAIGLPDGGWITVVRQSQGNPNLAQRYDANGVAVGAQVEVAEGMSRPLLRALAGQALALAWNFTGVLGDSDVRTQRIEAR